MFSALTMALMKQLRKIVIGAELVLISFAAIAVPVSAQNCGDSPASYVTQYASIPPECYFTESSRENPVARALMDNRRETDSAIETIQKGSRDSELPDLNRGIFYRNKLEFSLDVGWLPINIPFPFDILEGDAYNLYPLRYTLIPVVASLRWHLSNVGGPWALRGNWDLTVSGSATAIPRGAETRYFSYDMGVRRNFVPRHWRVSPYVDLRLGLGNIDAKGPLGVYYAQGQNFTFTCNLGSGVRYNFNPRYAISAGLNWMHISNNNLSAPQYSNYGINVYGPMVGIDIRLRGRRGHSDH